MASTVISASVVDVEDNCYIANGSDGVKYKIPVGAIEIRNGALISLDEKSVLCLHVPDDTEESQHSLPKDDDYTGQNNPTETKWSDAASKSLIEKYKEYRPLVEQRKIKTMKKMWEMIKKDLDDVKHNYSVQQVESKWKTLETAFKNTILNNKKTGRAKKRCAYESELSEILLPKKSLIPPCVMDEIQTTTDTEMLQESGIEVVADEHLDVSARATPDLSITPVKGKIRNKEIHLLAEALNRRTEEKKQIDKKNYEQRERLILQMEHKNQLLEQVLLNLSN